MADSVVIGGAAHTVFITLNETNEENGRLIYGENRKPCRNWRETAGMAGTSILNNIVILSLKE